VRMLERLDEPVSQWLHLTDRDFTVGTLDMLCGTAWRMLPPEDAAYVTGQLADIPAFDLFKTIEASAHSSSGCLFLRILEYASQSIAGTVPMD
jgi:hypothetical protein